MATFFLLLIYLAFISLGLPDSLLGAAWPAMHGPMGAPLGAAGLLSMTITVGTILSSLATGRLIGRFGTGAVTSASVAMTALALLGFAFSPGWGWLALFAVPLGLGAGAVDAGLNHYVAANYAARHMSWLHSFWGVGATLGPVIMAQAIQGGDWREGYATVGYLQLGLVAVLLASLPLWNKVARARKGDVGEGDAGARAESSAAAAKPIRLPGVKLALGSFLFYCGVEATLGLWGSSYLVGTKGFASDEAAKWISFYYGGITVGRFLTGFLTLRMSNRSLIRGGQALALAGTALLLAPLLPVFSLAGFIVIGLGLAPIFPCMLHETPSRFGPGPAQTIIGYQMAVAYTGSTLLPPLFGLLAGTFTISLLPGYLLLCAAAMWLCSEKLNARIAARAS
ncbi:MFS transporter [Paenibacillus albicereus]|uniref:MFS transporter n=1 Tax=Paenibacillus albicereus TaxID=2726185 RepID=A0A6H2GXG2_9BACL|nr:MFS transporter [Paenibacillus albicereus]QJC52087.1 MFS transporter [Paenibacillus albicereus]